MSKTILITGGAGFIGSHLCKYLIDQGNKVICLDNFFTGKKRNIENLKENPNFKIISHNIIEPINGKIKEHVDEIYNLACPASPIHYQFNAIETIKANTLGVINVLEFAKSNDSKVLQASTSEIYGDPEVHPQVESYRGNVNTLGPRACYDEGKRVAETLFMEYHRKYGIDIKIVRIFNTYGPNMAVNDGRVISNFIVSALKNKLISIYGDGEQTRSFCYVLDTIGAMVKLMNSNKIGPFNVGNPNELTIKEIAFKIREKINSSSEIIFQNLPEDDPLRRKPDISLITEKLEWKPQINLEEGLDKTIHYFRKILKNNKIK
jgi:UDP-glucuronate decarboxylase